MKIIKPIPGEEWIEEKRAKEFWIGQRRPYPQKLYSRLTKSYVGWWLYFRLHAIWGLSASLVDPLNSGGFYAHLRSFLYNWIVIRGYHLGKHRIWKIFHRKEWEQQRVFFRALDQASSEGYADSMPPPAGFPADRFHGSILGERYFKRVAEILANNDLSQVRDAPRK